MQRSKFFLGAGLAIMLGSMAHSAMAQSESRSAKSTATRCCPRSPSPIGKGWQLAVEEINAAGGIKRQEAGRRLQG